MIYETQQKRTLLTFLMLLTVSFITCAQDLIRFPEASGQLINPQVKVYHSPDELTADEALQQISEGKMEESPFKVNQGMNHPNDSYWLTFTISNASTIDQSAFLVIDYPQMDFIELFGIQDGTARILYTTGDQFLFEQRPVRSRNFVLPIKLTAERQSTYLLHFEKFKSTMRFPIYLYDEAGYQAHYFNSNLRYSIYFGFILLISLISMALGFIVRINTFKIYALYILSFALWLFTRLGYSYQFLVPNLPEFNRHLLAASGQLAIMGLILYVRSFFKTKDSMPGFHRVMDVVLVIFIIGAVVWASFPDFYVNFAPKLFLVRYTLFSTTVIFAFAAAINYHKVDRFRSRMFLSAYSLFLLAIIGKILMDYGVFNEQKLGFDPILLGFLVEVLVLSTAMGVLLKRTLNKSQNVQVAHQVLKKQVAQKEETERKGYLKLNSKAVIAIDHILYIKSDDHYLEFYLADGKKEIERNTLSQTIETLPPHFIQTHRSFVINLNHARALFADRIMMQNGDEVKLSRTFRKKFQHQLNSIQKN